ncbi:hypothetical protein SFRURICE_017087 [Spodoptera frugiperda]|nr:hypothetical protein SFRURICE_017087 [Spodoptera frugiperda]
MTIFGIAFVLIEPSTAPCRLRQKVSNCGVASLRLYAATHDPTAAHQATLFFNSFSTLFTKR